MVTKYARGMKFYLRDDTGSLIGADVKIIRRAWPRKHLGKITYLRNYSTNFNQFRYIKLLWYFYVTVKNEKWRNWTKNTPSIYIYIYLYSTILNSIWFLISPVYKSSTNNYIGIKLFKNSYFAVCHLKCNKFQNRFITDITT